nr:hypothetical protein [Tanacetum cinerariifolium]
MQTQTSNTLHNAIMEAGSKDRPPMLAPDNYVQWKSIIKRYIDTKPNHELIHYCLENPPYKLDWKDIEVSVSEGSPITTTARIHETYKNVSQEIRDQLNVEAEADGESLESYYSRFYKMMNELIRNQCKVTDHQVNVQFLLKLQAEWQRMVNHWNRITQEWQRFMTLVKQSQELKTVSYHKLYDILKQHQHEVNEIRAEKIARVANPLALVAQQQPKIYKPTNNNLQTSSNTSRANQNNSPKINRSVGYENQRIGNVVGARENVDVQNVIIDSLDMSYDREEIGQHDDDNDLAKKRELLASLIEKLKCEIDESKNR